jgi:hypothetical protein
VGHLTSPLRFIVHRSNAQHSAGCWGHGGVGATPVPIPALLSLCGENLSISIDYLVLWDRHRCCGSQELGNEGQCHQWALGVCVP